MEILKMLSIFYFDEITPLDIFLGFTFWMPSVLLLKVLFVVELKVLFVVDNLASLDMLSGCFDFCDTLQITNTY